MPIKICRQCKNEFKPSHGRQIDCSGECVRARERAYTRRHAATFSRDRKRAMDLTQRAIVRGDLTHQPCEVCGKDNRWDVVAHHDDYADPLNVRWLCRPHHKQHHLKFGPGKNAFAVGEKT